VRSAIRASTTFDPDGLPQQSSEAQSRSGCNTTVFVVFATTPHKHTQILNRAPDTVIAAIEDVMRQAS
jgi:hypothetical protein